MRYFIIFLDVCRLCFDVLLKMFSVVANDISRCYKCFNAR